MINRRRPCPSLAFGQSANRPTSGLWTDAGRQAFAGHPPDYALSFVYTNVRQSSLLREAAAAAAAATATTTMTMAETACRTRRRRSYTDWTCANI